MFDHPECSMSFPPYLLFTAELQFYPPVYYLQPFKSHMQLYMHICSVQTLSNSRCWASSCSTNILTVSPSIAALCVRISKQLPTHSQQFHLDHASPICLRECHVQECQIALLKLRCMSDVDSLEKLATLSQKENRLVQHYLLLTNPPADLLP